VAAAVGLTGLTAIVLAPPPVRRPVQPTAVFEIEPPGE
jgi:hypothetical protein